MSVKVDVEKSDQSRADGNASFKKGKWSEAIGHYTNAIIYNPTNPVNYSNRAQAFLKIDKYQDAERDCTTCLSLEKNNIKALYRRGLARKGLGKVDEAIQDLQQILSIDKTNETVKTEWEELLSLQKDKENKKSKTRRPITPPTTSIPTGASIQEIVDQTDSIDISSKGTNPTNSEDNVRPDDVGSTSTQAPPKSFASLRQQREGKKKAFVNGSTPLISEKQVKPTPSESDPVPSAAEQNQPPSNNNNTPPSANPTSPSQAITQPPPAPARSSSSSTPPSEEKLSLPTDLDVHSTSPGASLIFLRHLSSSPSPSAKQHNYSLISLYPPEIFSRILANLLEPDNLGLILVALEYGLSQVTDRQEEDEEEARKRIKVLMEGLKRSKRWGMNYSMLSTLEKSTGEKVWKECGGDGGLR